MRSTLTRIMLAAMVLFCTVITSANATVALSSLFGSNMVLQREKVIPVTGTASPNKTITVVFNGQTKTTTSDAQGNWQLNLDPMGVKATGGNFTASESGANTVTLTNVVVGDVWICSGQSNMAMGLGSCNRQTEDVATANYPGIRHIWIPLANLGEPSKTFSSNWSVCSSNTAAGFSAVAFYFGRKIYTDQSAAIPIGLIASTVGGTCIDPWLAPEGGSDIPVISPIYSQSILPWGPFSLFNGMIHPLAPLPAKGAIWYQGENRETTSQSTDSYYLKQKALQQGWKRLLRSDDFALYVVQLANWLDSSTTVIPDMPGTSWSDTRIQQANVLGLAHAGMASAMDVGEAADIHPKDKLDVGERLALWALKNDYGRTSLVTSGPILKDVTVSGNKIICSFDYVGSGLMVGSKTPYQPTAEVVGGTLQRFSIAGATGSWYAANAVINGNTVELSSASVSAPRKVAYACWTNPAGANLYNKEGLPASPFYVDDVTAKYTVTASATTNGSISPAGATTYLKRKTALYTITPNAGFYIQDVKVDGVSVGAVKTYTFDPLYANHTISATFTETAPTNTITATSNAGGSVSPAGTVTVAQGGAQTFTISAGASTQIASVTVDGVPVGKRTSFTFSDVRSNHTISASFACTITAASSFGGSISPSGANSVAYGSNKTFAITPMTGYTVSNVKVDGQSVGAVTSYTFTNVTTDHTISASFSGTTGGVGSIPKPDQLIMAALASTLPSSGNTGNWATYYPTGGTLTTIGSPSAETLNGRKWERNLYIDGDGYRFGGSYASSIPCTGATIVVAASPIRTSNTGNWSSIVDVFYDRLVLGIKNDTGQVNVRRNGSVDWSTNTIPDGQMTILSLVVQQNGTYKVYANGSLFYTNTGTSDMSALVPGVTGGAGGYGSYINVGRNNPDGWTVYNGNIGDVFLYKTALGDAERTQLEQYIANKLTDYAITATAGTGGTITPSGINTVMSGASQTFTIAPSAGYAIADVKVDGVSQGAISSYTFSAVSAGHTIAATFSRLPVSITASTGTPGGTISPSGTVSVTYGENKTFTIAAAEGYRVADVVVDGVSVGAVTSYTFSSLAADHTIVAKFGQIVASVAALKEKANGSWVCISGPVSTKTFNGYFYMQDSKRNMGIRVIWPGTAYAGRVVEVRGVMETNADFERCLRATSVTFGDNKTCVPVGIIGKRIGGGAYKYNEATGAGQRGLRAWTWIKTGNTSVHTLIDVAGLNNIGLLVRTWGKVVQSDAGSFVLVDDGSGYDDGNPDYPGVRVVVPAGVTPPQKGSYVVVTGISSCYQVSGIALRQLLPGSGADIEQKK